MNFIKKIGRGKLDMVSGSPWKQILLFSIPLLLGNILQQLYNTVDSMVVGNFVGSGALAAVGTSTPVIRLLIGFFMGVSAGTGIVVSQAFGAKDFDRLHTITHTITTVTLLVGTVISLAGAVFAPFILRMLNTPQSVFDMARDYMVITSAGILSVMMFNVVNGILHGMGDAGTPFLILLVSSLINIVLDLLFVIAFHWDVAGVAWATVIAQVAAVAFGLYRLGRSQARLSIHKLRINWSEMKKILHLGVPSGMQNVLQSVGNILVQGVINGFGPVIMAANIAVIKVDSFCTMPMMTFATAITVFVGQNVGAGRYDRIRTGTRAALCMSVGVSAVISAALYFFGSYPLRLFTNEAAVVQAGMDKFHIVAPFYFCISIFGVLSGVIRGNGQTVVPMIVGVLTMFIGRVPVSFLLSRQIGANGVHWSLSVQWALEAVVIMAYYFLGRWQKWLKLEKNSGVLMRETT